MFRIDGEFPVWCPSCNVWFMFPTGEVIHDPNQLPTEEELREAHPEVSEPDDVDEEC